MLGFKWLINVFVAKNVAYCSNKANIRICNLYNVISNFLLLTFSWNDSYSTFSIMYSTDRIDWQVLFESVFVSFSVKIFALLGPCRHIYNTHLHSTTVHACIRPRCNTTALVHSNYICTIWILHSSDMWPQSLCNYPPAFSIESCSVVAIYLIVAGTFGMVFLRFMNFASNSTANGMALFINCWTYTFPFV